MFLHEENQVAIESWFFHRVQGKIIYDDIIYSQSALPCYILSVNYQLDFELLSMVFKSVGFMKEICLSRSYFLRSLSP